MKVSRNIYNHTLNITIIFFEFAYILVFSSAQKNFVFASMPPGGERELQDGGREYLKFCEIATCLHSFNVKNHAITNSFPSHRHIMHTGISHIFSYFDIFFIFLFFSLLARDAIIFRKKK